MLRCGLRTEDCKIKSQKKKEGKSGKKEDSYMTGGPSGRGDWKLSEKSVKRRLGLLTQ